MDYFSRKTTSPSRPQQDLLTPGAANRPALGVRRLTSNNSITLSSSNIPRNDEEQVGRRRSLSAPQRPQRASQPLPDLRRQATASNLPRVTEEGSQTDSPGPSPAPLAELQARLPIRQGRFRASSGASGRHRAGSSAANSAISAEQYEPEVVDFLDVIDPEVSTLTTLNNVQNSLFIPYLGNFLNRRPTYDLSRHNTDTSSSDDEPVQDPLASENIQEEGEDEDEDEYDDDSRPVQELDSVQNPLGRTSTLSSVLTTRTGRYAVLPHGTILDGWTDEDKNMLNDYVRHMLHSRRSKFKQSMRAFGKYVQKPLGAFVTIYAFLLTFWGAAWIIFIIGWIHTGNRQAYFIEICDEILTALFAVVGLGLAPFRAVDTYHMIYIAHYHYKTWKLRRKLNLPDLQDPNDLPEPKNENDLELARAKTLETIVLTPQEEKKLLHHQKKFARSHTFYKPHETYTHRAFSIKLLIAIVVLLDCHSIFQAALGGTTWGIYYKRRPKALTAIILSCSISCNISGGITISVGDHKSRKKEIVEQIFRQNLTREALKKLEKDRGLHALVPAPVVEKKHKKSKKSKQEKLPSKLAIEHQSPEESELEIVSEKEAVNVADQEPDTRGQLEIPLKDIL